MAKKFVSLFLALAMCLTVPVFAIEEDSQREADLARATNVLLQSGWTKEEIDDFLTEEALLAYKDAQPAVASEKKYYKISEDGMSEISEEDCLSEVEYLNELEHDPEKQISPFSKIEEGDIEKDEQTTYDGYMVFYVSAHNLGNKEYMLSARFEWLISPFNRKEDVFGLGHSSQLEQQGSAGDVYYVYKADYTINSGGIITEYPYETNTPNELKVDSGGTVIRQQLAGESLDFVGSGDYVSSSHHRGFLQYKVKVNNYAATAVSVQAEYYHQQTLISISPSVSWPAGGSISVATMSEFKAMTPNPYLPFDI